MTKVALKGGAYQSHSVIAAAQRCLNLYPETGPTTAASSGASVSNIGEPSVVAHYPTPGTRLLGSIGTGPIRGIRQCSTGGVYVVSGDTLYLVNVGDWSGTPLGTLTPGIRTPVSMVDNGLDMVVVDGSANGWTVTLADNTFAQINDPNGMFIGADRVDYLDTFFIFNKPGTPQFYISGSLAVTFDSLDFANKAAYSDLLMTTVVCKRLIYLVGERTTEIWYESGETFSTTAGQSASVSEATAVVAFQFAPMQSEVFVDHGTVAKYSPAVYDNYMFWLTRDRQGQGAVHAIAGYESKRVSTFAIEQEIAGYDRIWDAIGFCYRLGGHAYYVLTFPHADKTWVYDIITGLWHEWGWIDSNGSEHRHRANCYFAVNDLGVVGDWQNGNIYVLDHRVFTDNGGPIKRVRAFPHMLADGKRVFYRQFLADLETGWAPEVPVSFVIPPMPEGPSGFFALPRMAGGGNNGNTYGISYDGHTACGFVSPPIDDTFQVGCYWTSASGDWSDTVGPVLLSDPDPVTGPNTQAFGASGDGSIIVGITGQADVGGIPGNNLDIPFRWTASGGFVPFDTVTGAAQAISADGSRITGYSRIFGFDKATSVYWDAVTLAKTTLPQLPGHDNSFPIAISVDGTVIVGASRVGFDSNTYRPWRWTAATGTVDLGLPSGVGATNASATGCSGDGNTVVGYYGTAITGGSWQWTPGTGMVVIDPVFNVGAGISGDASTIVGSSAADNIFAYFRAGVMTVPTPVPLDPAYPGVIQSATGNWVSGDGTVMVGSTNPGLAPNYVPFVYLAPKPTGGGTVLAAGVVSLISLDWSDDRGHSFGSPVTQPIGATGEYRTSLQWQRLGMTRDRVFRISWSVPMRTALQGAWIDATPAQS